MSRTPLHAGTGVQRFAFGDDENSSPTLWSKWQNLINGHLNLLTDANQGHVVALTGLNVGAFAMRYRLGAADHAFPGETGFACTASVTNHLYVDAGQVLRNDITGWPSGDHVKLAEVITGASSVTQVIDCRFRNFLIGIINAWSTELATSTVDFADFGIDNLGSVQLGAPSELTIAAGSITPTGI